MLQGLSVEIVLLHSLPLFDGVTEQRDSMRQAAAACYWFFTFIAYGIGPKGTGSRLKIATALLFSSSDISHCKIIFFGTARKKEFHMCSRTCILCLSGVSLIYYSHDNDKTVGRVYSRGFFLTEGSDTTQSLIGALYNWWWVKRSRFHFTLTNRFKKGKKKYWETPVRDVFMFSPYP